MNYGRSIFKRVKKQTQIRLWIQRRFELQELSHRFYEDVQFNEYRKDPDLVGDTRLFRDRSSIGDLAENDVMWTALVGQSSKIQE